MDQPKPQFVQPQVLEFDYEATAVEERRERRGESLWRVLDERHINMIAFSGTVGNGLFLGSGTSLALAGPGGAVISYIIMGTVVSVVISCLGEMTALMPVNAPIMEFPRRFLDRGVGFAVGWMYWFAFTTAAANQVVAVSNSISFLYHDDHGTFLQWATGKNVDPAVWVTVFIILVTLVNILPVLYYGELEYILGCFKLTFIAMLIVMMLVLNTMHPRGDAYYDQPLGTKYWDKPYSFFNPSYSIKDDDGNVQNVIGGQLGQFLGVWTGMINVVFSYTGMDIVAATAAESKSLADAESMKMAARKICIRIVTLYTLAMLTGSFMVPYDHPFLNGQGQSVGSRSIFIIAVVEAGIPTAAYFFNAVYLLSAFSCGATNLYVASRVLHTMSLQGQTGPQFITRRLKQCNSGVPVRAVLVSAVMMLLAYMSRTGSPGMRLREIGTNCTVSFLIVYAVICATYLRFFRTLEVTKSYGGVSEAQAQSYDRNNPRYPYKSHGQWLKACYGLVACTIIVVFNGVPAFLGSFKAHTFLSSYAGVPVFVLLIIAYKIKRHGFRISEWGPERSNDLGGTIQASSGTRKGRLELPDHGLTKANGLAFLKWIWVWLR